MTLRPDVMPVKIPFDLGTAYRRPLATNSFGGEIATINGWHSRPVLRPGTRIVVDGKGFQPWVRTGTTRSFIYLAYPVAPSRDETYTMKILSWSDTRIVADLPLDARTHPHPETEARVTLTIYALSPEKLGTYLKVPKIRFIP